MKPTKNAGRLFDIFDLEGKRFLDVGCGNGWACRQAASQGAIATGVDRDIDNLEAGRMLGIGHFEPFTEQLPFDDAAFDFVWITTALHETPEILPELRRVLAADGELHAVIEYYLENDASHNWNQGLLRSEQDWIDALHAAGFAHVDAERLRAHRLRVDPWKRRAGSLHLLAHL